MSCTTKYIYCIENKVNGKKYVGKTDLSVEARWELHKKETAPAGAVLTYQT